MFIMSYAMPFLCRKSSKTRKNIEPHLKPVKQQNLPLSTDSEWGLQRNIMKTALCCTYFIYKLSITIIHTFLTGKKLEH